MRRTQSSLRVLAAHDQAGIIVFLIVGCLVLTVLSPYFLTVSNGLNIGRAVSYWGIAAVATTIVLVGGQLDLSIGAIMALVGVVCALLLEQGVAPGLVVAAGIACGAGLGAINGGIVAYGGINPFIATISTQFIFRGIAFAIAGGRAILILSSGFTFLGQGDLGLPVPMLILLATFGVIAWTMRATRFGRHAYSIGGSSEASRLVGIPVSRRRFQLLVVSGAFAGLSGVVLAAYTGQGAATAGPGIELTVVAAVILGGTSLFGGRGTAAGTLIGIAILGILNNGVTLLGIPYYWQYVVQGSALLLAVAVDEYREKRAAR